MVVWIKDSGDNFVVLKHESKQLNIAESPKIEKKVQHIYRNRDQQKNIAVAVAHARWPKLRWKDVFYSMKTNLEKPFDLMLFQKTTRLYTGKTSKNKWNCAAMEPRLYVRPGRCLYTGQLVDRALSIAEPSRNPIPFLDPWQREAELCTSCHLPSNHYKQNKAGGFPWKINVLDSDLSFPYWSKINSSSTGYCWFSWPVLTI